MTQGVIDSLVGRDARDVRAWEAAEFDRLSAGRPVVLMGAGGLGRRALAGLRRHAVEPLAFVDNSPGGTTLDGVPVMTPADAARRYGTTAAFVVTIWGAHRPHRFAHSSEQLRALGCDVVLPFPPLFWKYADALLPFYLQDLPSHVVEDREAVRAGLDLWADDRSRDEYVAQVRFRVAADFEGLPQRVDEPQYFPSGLFTWSDAEWILDGGAYDGDTVRALSSLHQNRFGHLLAVEPDPVNYGRLVATINDLPPDVRSRVDCRQVALGASPATLHLDVTGTASSATSTTSSASSIAVQAETIDDLVGDATPTFIKLDIEGYEPDALEGGRRTIERHAPVLAVCVYHRQDHLWRIPLQLREWCPGASLFLRPHNEEGWDLVCYVVPPSRLVGGRS